jgi:WD40 repeat protein
LFLACLELQSGDLVRTLKGDFGSIDGVALSADGGRVVFSTWREKLRVWDPETDAAARTVEGAEAVGGVAVSADGQHAICVSRDRKIQVWDLETGALVRTLDGHSAPVVDLALSMDGRRLVSASDKTLNVWDLETPILVAAFSCEEPLVSCRFGGSRMIFAVGHAGSRYFLSLELPG